jgi:hypothetical protein
MMRLLEILVGLMLGGSGLLTSIGAIVAGVSVCQRVLEGKPVPEPGIGPFVGMAIVGLLMLLGAWKLMRRPPSSGAPRGRWLALAACGSTLTVLFAIVYPNFINFSKRSKASEPRLVLSSIKTAEEAYFAEFGEYLPFAPVPYGLPRATPTQQIEYPVEVERLGWSLEPPVYCSYSVAVGSFNASGHAQAFTAEAVCDLDGDGALMAWGYVRPDRDSGEVVPGPFGRCAAEGAIDQSSGEPRPAMVGPCDARSAYDIF